LGKKKLKIKEYGVDHNAMHIAILYYYMFRPLCHCLVYHIRKYFEELIVAKIIFNYTI